MGGFVDLLTSLPKSNRDIKARAEAKNAEVIRIAKTYGHEYFDGDRKYGYGGYKYDGRWTKVALDIMNFFDLKKDDKVLDIGCAKGYLMWELGFAGKVNSYGLDISEYAIENNLYYHDGRALVGTAEKLPFDDKSFDLVISINTLHNLPRDGVIRALKEIERVSMGKSYIVVDSYRTPEEKELFESWCLTAETHMYPAEWEALFKEAGYTGWFSWNML